ncbi:hypothetical protein HPB51_018429 [Rhipicephalus microplus]|uniref:SWIM-type domain-containing protein n=1 Tax=Rhipicephalus microplus TaxID=6941 RepID=A0A9J6EIY0_RHIMP|nr:hypothetical protein HPB51_018429 [Rhipicephalus microplus]
MQICAHTRSVASGTCSCEAGITSRCKHAAAVCAYVNEATDDTCTSRPQQWGKPSKKPKRDVNKTIADLFPAGPLTCAKDTRPESPTDVMACYEDLVCPLNSVLKAMKMTEVEWHEARKYRLTRSSCHSIRTRRKLPEALAKQMTRKKPFSTPATRYGLRNEPKARKALEQKLQTPNLETGLVMLPEQPWLACSPDGLMRYEGNTVLVEIKCPARCEKVPIIDKEGKTILEFFDCQAGALTLKKSRSFYTRLQLQLYIMNLSQAVFYAWSPVQDDKFLFVDRNMNFLSEVVPKLEFFYFTYLLEELSKTT